MHSRTRVIGIDFDNTIACYDELLFRLAVERGLTSADSRKGKKAIRDHIRMLPDGELAWQRLQAIMYGPAIDGAQPFDGVFDFLCSCRSAGIVVHVISHKTAYSNLLGDGVNFRAAATQWMRDRGFLDPGGPCLSLSQVWYEPTRAAKVSRIRSLGCTMFIDDLEETFNEDAFPAEVTKVLFNPHREPVQARDVLSCANWSQIQDMVIHDSSRCN